MNGIQAFSRPHHVTHGAAHQSAGGSVKGTNISKSDIVGTVLDVLA